MEDQNEAPVQDAPQQNAPQRGERMRLLLLIDSLGRSGSEVSLAENLAHYRRAGIRPIIACLEEREGVGARVRAEGYDVRVLPQSRLSVGSSLFDSFLTRVRALRQVIRTERPHLVHTTLPQANLVGRVAAAGTGVPVLTSLVNMRYGPERLGDPSVKHWKMRVLQLIDATSARLFTDHFHAVTHAVKEAAVADLWIPASRISVVERGRSAEKLGVPSAARRRRAREKLGLAEDAEVLLNVGRQEHQKGQAHLLEAVAPLMRERPGLVLLVAGVRGHASPRLDRVRRDLGLAPPRVRFLGHRDDVPELLAAADVFVFPSLFEGIGGAAIEAMALGLPIVASDIAPMREINEVAGRGEAAAASCCGNALLAEAGSARALGAALLELLGDPERRQAMGRRGRVLFEERFTLERNARRMARLCYQVARGHARGAPPQPQRRGEVQPPIRLSRPPARPMPSGQNAVLRGDGAPQEVALRVAGRAGAAGSQDARVEDASAAA